MAKAPGRAESAKASATQAAGRCACGAVRLKIDVPAVWAWHDHSAAGRRAHGGAYATYVGSWKSRFEITAGAEHLTRYEDEASGTARSFCAQCGTPVLYERPRSPKMVNIPRSLFAQRTVVVDSRTGSPHFRFVHFSQFSVQFFFIIDCAVCF